MAITKGQNFQDVQESTLPVLGQAARTTDEVITSKVDQQFDIPLRLHATFPTPNIEFVIGPSTVQNADGTSRSIVPQALVIPAFPGAVINFGDGSTSGGTVSITLPTTTVGFFRRCAFSLTPGGVLVGSFSAQSATLVGLANPGTLFSAANLNIGWIDLEAYLSNSFKTAGSATNIIENSVGGVSRINYFTMAASNLSGAGFTAGSVLFADGTAIAQDNANFFWDDSNNRLGLGLNSPQGVLHTRTSGAEGIHLFDSYRNSTNGSNFYLRFARGTSGSPLAVQLGDSPGQIIASVYDGTTFHNNAYLRPIVDGPVSAGTVPTAWAFLTSQTGGGSLSEKMRLSSAGDLGIGTDTPLAKIDARTSTGAVIIAGRTTNVGAASEPGSFEVRAPNASGNARLWTQIKCVVDDPLNGTEDADLVFSTQSNGSFVENMRLFSTNLGIGLTAPSHKIHIRTDAAAVAMFEAVDTGSHTIKFNQFNGYVPGSINKFAFTQDTTGSSENAALYFDFTNQKLSMSYAGTTNFSIDSNKGFFGTIANNSATFNISGAEGSCTAYSTTGTNRGYFAAQNNGGSAIFGIDSSGGGSLATGSSAFATVAGSGGSRNFEFITNNTVKMILTPAGALGLGVSPSFKFDVFANQNGGTIFRLASNAIGGTNADTALDLASNNGTTVTFGRIGLNIVTASVGIETGGLFFSTMNNGSFAPRMYLDGQGLGIGREPNKRLDVFHSTTSASDVIIGSISRTNTAGTGEYGLFVSNDGGGATTGITSLAASGTNGHKLKLNTSLVIESAGNSTFTASNLLTGNGGDGVVTVVNSASGSGNLNGLVQRLNSSGVGEGIILHFQALNSSSAPKTYATIAGSIAVNTAGSERGYLGFYTNFVGTISEKMRLSPEGYLGIGRTPTAAGILEVYTTSGGSLSAGYFWNHTSNGNGMDVITDANTSSNYVASLRANGGSVTVLYARADGKVGFGTSSPNSTLHAVGNSSNYLSESLTGTERNFYQSTNTGGNATFGVDNNSGGSLFANAPAYSGGVGTQNSTDMVIGAGGVARIFVSSGGNIGLGVVGQAGYVLKSQNSTSDNTLNRHFYMVPGAGSAVTYLGTYTGNSGSSVLLPVELNAAIAYVLATDGTNSFCDIVLLGQTGAGSPVTVASMVIAGTPGARTYSSSSNNLNVSVASGGPYRYNVRHTQMSFR